MNFTDHRKYNNAAIAMKAVVFFVGVGALAIVFIFSMYKWRVDQLFSDARNEEKMTIAMLGETITRDIHSMLMDLQIISKYSALTRYLDDRTESNRLDLEKDFSDIERVKRNYAQIRLLGLTGREEIRVDYADGKTVIVPEKELQDKSDRYYFKDAIDLGQGRIYVSPMDLNVEHGVIETPYKPMVRAAMPVFDGENREQGVLVLNYLAGRLFDHLGKHIANTNGTISLLNADGYWLLAPSADDAWGFMFKEKKDRSFAVDFPKAWETLSKDDAGQFSTANGTFTFLHVHPTDSARVDMDCSIAPSHADWIIVSRIGPDEISAMAKPVQSTMTAISGVILLGLAPIAWLLARFKVKRDLAVMKLTEREKLYRVLAENFPNGAVFLFNNEATCLLAEGRGLKPFGAASKEVKGKGIEAIFPDECKEILNDYFDKALKGQESSFELEIRQETYQLHIIPITGLSDQVFAEMLMTQNITQRKRMEEDLRNLASVDALTGLSNRRRSLEDLGAAIAFSKRHNVPLCLCMCDIDQFKTVNDVHGHVLGDAVLAKFGAIIRNRIRETDHAGRYGGDEFIIFFPNTSADDAFTVVNHIRTILRETAFTDDAGAAFTVSGRFGLAEFSPGQSPQDLIAAADEALYAAKRAGRDAVRTKPDAPQD